MKARPRSPAGPAPGSLTTPRVSVSRRHRPSPDRSVPCAFPCRSQGALAPDWSERPSVPPTGGGAVTGGGGVRRGPWAACAGPSPAPPGAPAAASGCWRRGCCSPRRRTASAALSSPAMPKPPWYILPGGGEGARRRQRLLLRHRRRRRSAGGTRTDRVARSPSSRSSPLPAPPARPCLSAGPRWRQPGAALRSPRWHHWRSRDRPVVVGTRLSLCRTSAAPVSWLLALRGCFHRVNAPQSAQGELRLHLQLGGKGAVCRLLVVVALKGFTSLMS